MEQISDAILTEWKRQAEADGNTNEYNYHLGMIYPPLPYLKWHLKKTMLDRIQARQDYKDGLDLPMGVEDRHDQLIKELGY